MLLSGQDSYKQLSLQYQHPYLFPWYKRKTQHLCLSMYKTSVPFRDENVPTIWGFTPLLPIRGLYKYLGWWDCGMWDGLCCCTQEQCHFWKVDNNYIHFYATFFPQGIWSSYLSNIYTEHVHPFRSKSSLWLCDVCKDSARSGGGRSTHHFSPFIYHLFLEIWI